MSTTVITGSYRPSCESVTLEDANARPANYITQIAFYAFMATLPFETDMPLPVALPALTGSIFLLTTLLQPGVCYRTIPKTFWYFATCFAVAMLSSLINGLEYPARTVKSGFIYVQVLFLLMTSYNIMRGSRVATVAVATLAIAAVVRAGLQILGIGAVSTNERVTVLAQNHNYGATVMATGLLILVGLVYGRSRSLIEPRFLIWPFVGICGVAIIQTGSRGGLVSLIAGLLCFVFRGSNIRQKLTGIVVALFAVTCVVWVAYNSDMMRQRWLDALQQGDLSKRERLYPFLWQMVCERPVIGWGPHGYAQEAGRRLRLPRWKSIPAHNLPLQILASRGVVGAIPTAFAIWGCVYCAWRARAGPQGTLPLALILTLLVSSLSSGGSARLLWFAYAYALASGTDAISRRQRSHLRDNSYTTKTTPSTSVRKRMTDVRAGEVIS